MKLIGQAMGFEEAGYAWTFDAQTAIVKGKIDVGSKTIEVTDPDPTKAEYVVSGVEGANGTYATAE